jgi:hypothetical protein
MLGIVDGITTILASSISSSLGLVATLEEKLFSLAFG